MLNTNNPAIDLMQNKNILNWKKNGGTDTHITNNIKIVSLIT